MKELNLRFAGGETEGHELSAAHLIHALEGLQRAYHLIAMEAEDIEVRQRDRVSREIEERYAIRVSPPQRGSVCFALTLEEPEVDDDSDSASHSFLSCCEAVMKGDGRQLRRVVPDKTRRQRLVEAFKSAMPRRGSGISLSLLDSSGTPVLTSSGVERGVSSLLLKQRTPETHIQTVTGILKAIAFDRRQLTLLYPVTQRELRCFYSEAAEEMLLTNPRELIQVTGTVVLDQDDQPMEIQDVQDIREVDLTPFRLSDLDLTAGHFVLQPPLVLEPHLDDTMQLLLVSHEPLGIELGAPTRDELFDSLVAEFDMLWSGYAEAADSSLTAGARQLKSRLKALLVRADATN